MQYDISQTYVINMDDLNLDATIYSPRHVIPQNNQSMTSTELDTFKEKGNLRDIFHTYISTVPEQARSVFRYMYDKIQNKTLAFRKAKNKTEEVRENIFVTKSSKEAEIEKEEEINSDKPLAYPIISVTILAFPYAFKEAGFPLGLFILISISIMMDYSEVLLVQCSLLADDTSIQNISREMFGLPGLVIMYTLPYMLSFCILVSYNMILADTFTKFLNALLELFKVSVIIDRKLALLWLYFIIIPISMSTNIKRIFKWSLVSLLSATFVMVLVLVKWLTLSSRIVPTTESYKFLNINVLKSFGIMTFAISCQHTCRLYYSAIDQTKDISPNKPANIASSYSLLCTIILGVFGFLTFTSHSQINILENYCEEDIFAMIARLLVTIFALCLFPIECDNMRRLIKQIINVHKQFQTGFNYIVTLVTLLPPFTLACFINCLAQVLSWSGILLAVPLILIAPPLLFIQLSPGTISSTKKLPCLVCIAIGSIITLSGVTMELFAQQPCLLHEKPLSYCNDWNNLLGPQITLKSLNHSVVHV